MHEARLAGIILVGVGASFTLFAANANALVQLAAPDHLRGRLVALYLFAFVGLAPLGSLLSGTLVEVGGTRLAFVVAGTVGLAATAFAAVGEPRPSARRPSNEGAPADGTPPISRVPACHEEELDDDLREPRFRLREQPDGRRRARPREPRTARRPRRRSFGAPDTRRVILRVHGDENIVVGSAEGRENAVQIARDMVQHIEQAATKGEWPQIDERFIRPGAIVSIDVQRPE